MLWCGCKRLKTLKVFNRLQPLFSTFRSIICFLGYPNSNSFDYSQNAKLFHCQSAIISINAQLSSKGK
jgi:hypothetical protein